MSDIKLIVGLGNPGSKYEFTRHNIGFLVIDSISHQRGITMSNHLRWRAHIGKHPSTGALLMKPQTFMNESGFSVGAALRYHKYEPEEILVVYDDVSLPFGTLRFRMAGSAGGHNGIKSIISHLKSDRFPRLKIGIGAFLDKNGESLKNQANPQKSGLVGHVLGKFSEKERNELQNTLATAAEAVQFALAEGVQAAANTFNTKKKSSEKKESTKEPSNNDEQ